MRLLKEYFTQEEPNVFLLLEILTGVEEETWQQVVAGDIEDQVTKLILFLQETPKLGELPVPKFVEISGKRLEVPTSIHDEAWGQIVYLRSVANKFMKEETPDLIELIPHAAATYLFKEFYGEAIDSKKMRAFVELIKDAPLLEIDPIGRFFFTKFSERQNQKTQRSPLVIRPSKKPPELQSLKSTAFFQRLTRWLRVKFGGGRRS
jgi:hypothetical protein